MDFAFVVHRTVCNQKKKNRILQHVYQVLSIFPVLKYQIIRQLAISNTTINSMNFIHSFSNFRPWAFFRILETIFTADTHQVIHTCIKIDKPKLIYRYGQLV